MENISEFLQLINPLEYRSKMEEIINWIKEKYPRLKLEIKWNQPMFTDHGTFIIAFSVSKQHIAVAPERIAIQQFAGDIEKAGYNYSKEIFRIKWSSPVDYSLLEKIIDFNILDKTDCNTFWRK